MKHLALIMMITSFAALPLSAQEATEDDGLSLMEEGAKLFFRGIITEMEPAIDDLRGLADEMEPALRDFADEMGPALADLFGKIENLNAYHPPEVQPNGDIILRRKTPQELADNPADEIEI